MLVGMIPLLPAALYSTRYSLPFTFGHQTTIRSNRSCLSNGTSKILPSHFPTTHAYQTLTSHLGPSDLLTLFPPQLRHEASGSNSLIPGRSCCGVYL